MLHLSSKMQMFHYDRYVFALNLILRPQDMHFFRPSEHTSQSNLCPHGVNRIRRSRVLHLTHIILLRMSSFSFLMSSVLTENTTVKY